MVDVSSGSPSSPRVSDRFSSTRRRPLDYESVSDPGRQDGTPPLSSEEGSAHWKSQTILISKEDPLHYRLRPLGPGV